MTSCYTGVPHNGEEMYDNYHHHAPIDDVTAPRAGVSASSVLSAASTEMDGIDWAERSEHELMTSLNVSANWKAAKNVIVFIGDGMGLSTLTSARFLKAQTSGNTIADTTLTWEKFPTTGIVKV